MAKTGSHTTGEGKTGDGYPDIVAPTPTTITATSPSPGSLVYGIQAPTTQLNISYPISDGATYPLVFPQSFGEHLEPSLVYGIQTPTTTLTTDTPPPGASGTGNTNISPTTSTISINSPTPFVGYEQWQIDGSIITASTREIATDRTLALTYRVTSTELLSTLRSLKDNEGQVTILGDDSGGFVSVDRSNGANSFTFTPPAGRRPLRDEKTLHVQRYEESLVSQDVSEWSVELDLALPEDRNDTPSISETPTSDEWGFQTRYGEIATSRVDADLLGRGEGGVPRFELVTRFRHEQAWVFEQALARIGGVRVRGVPDGDNEVVDDTSSDVGTLVVDAPDGQSEVSDGSYGVLGWESTRLNDAFQEVSMVIAPV